MRTLVVACVAALSVPTVHAQQVVHVNPFATGADDGTSWADAYTRLDIALANAPSPSQLWLYATTYAFPPPSPRSSSFVVRPGLEVYGGFDGTETTLAPKPALYRSTILSGEIGAPNDPSDNVHHVVTTWGPARIQGVVVEGGRADVAGDHRGGGIHCAIVANQGTSLFLDAVTLRRNHAQQGGGLFAMLVTVRMRRCELADNTASLGGAVYAMTLSIRADACVLRDNVASSKGGAVFLSSIGSYANGRPKVEFVDSLFHSNSADRGGAAYLSGSQFSSGRGAFTHCTFGGNFASDLGGALFAVTTSPVRAVSWIENSIVWGNQAVNGGRELYGRHLVRSSDAPGGGASNFYADPSFVAGSYVPAPGSIVRDRGANSLVPADTLDLDGDGVALEALPMDLRGFPRQIGAAVDCGAYER